MAMALENQDFDLERKIMAMALENQDFDLEFFMKSTDVDLYNIAREIFSYLDPVDLNNLWAIGKKNKMIHEFLKKEKNFLYEKFEKVTLKVWKKKTGQLIGPGGETRRMLENRHRVDFRIQTRMPGRFSNVTITGNLVGVTHAVYHVQDMFRAKYSYIEKFDENNSETYRYLDEKINEKLDWVNYYLAGYTDSSDKFKKAINIVQDMNGKCLQVSSRKKNSELSLFLEKEKMAIKKWVSQN